jgi:hypothetical protein
LASLPLELVPLELDELLSLLDELPDEDELSDDEELLPPLSDEDEEAEDAAFEPDRLSVL